MEPPQFQIHAALERTHWWFIARRRIVRTLIETLEPASPDSTIVEIGCGTGGNVADLSASYACVGVDIEPEAIGRARQRFPGLKFVCGVAPQDVKSELAQARVVLLLDVLEHVRDDFLMLSQVLAAIPPGAYVLLTVPADPKLWTQHDVSFGHFRRYDRSRLAATWEGIGVSCLLCSYFNSRLYLPIKWIRWLNRRLRRTSGSSGTDFAQPGRIMNRLLHCIFCGERHILTKALASSAQSGYRRGVSLIAVLQRLAGEIIPRTMPVIFETDTFNHETGVRGCDAFNASIDRAAVEMKERV